jgi:TldD protein
MIDRLEKVLAGTKADFVELRGSMSSANRVTIRNAEVQSVNCGALSIFSVRLLNKGSWGFASTNSIDGLQKAARTALKLAQVSQKRSLESALSAEEAHVDDHVAKVRINPKDIALDDKIARLIEINKSQRIEKRINSYETGYVDSVSKCWHVNSEGSRISCEGTASIVTYSSWVKEGKNLQAMARSYGGLVGYEVLDNCFERAADISQRAIKLLDAKLVKSGNYDLVVDPRMAGTMAHEALGHACEADAVLTGESTLMGRLGEKIGSDMVTICDDPTIPEAFGSYPYDDEGVKARKTTLLQNGVLKSYLHSRETAHKMKCPSTANARAQTVGHFPTVRMSNTYFEKGDQTYDELIDIKKGVYIEGMKGGAVEISTGDFQFAAEQGWTIEDGELTQPLRDVVIFGNILKTLKDVDAMSDKVQGFFPGNCGKGMQMVRVADGGPFVRVRGVRVGGA